MLNPKRFSITNVAYSENGRFSKSDNTNNAAKNRRPVCSGAKPSWRTDWSTQSNPPKRMNRMMVMRLTVEEIIAEILEEVEQAEDAEILWEETAEEIAAETVAEEKWISWQRRKRSQR